MNTDEFSNKAQNKAYGVRVGLLLRNIEKIDDEFYRLAALCYEEKIEVIFKGGCLLRHILRSIGTKVHRGTEDIDFDMYINSYEKFIEVMGTSVSVGKLRDNLQMNIHLVGLNIDCDVKILDDGLDYPRILYEGKYGKFWGVTVEDMLADKIASVSGRFIIGRVKDIFDIQVITTTKNLSFDISVLRALLKLREMGDFSVIETEEARIYKALRDYTKEPENVLRHTLVFIDGIKSEKNQQWNGRAWIDLGNTL